MLKISFLIFATLFSHSLTSKSSDPFYIASEEIMELTEDGFDYAIAEDSVDVWAIHFYTPSNKESRNFVPQFERAAKILKKLVSFGGVNLDKEPILGHRFSIKKIPSVIFIDRDKAVVRYDGPLSDSGVIEFAKDVVMEHFNFGLEKRLVDSRLVKELGENDVDKNGKNGVKFWLVAFYNSTNNDVTDEFKEMVESTALSLKDIIDVGAYDVNKGNTPISYKTLPILVLFHGKKASRREVEYTGVLNGEAVVEFVMARIKPPQIVELWTEAVLADVCAAKKYCIITFLPRIAKCNEDCKLQYKEVLEEVAEEYKTLSAVWALVRRGVMTLVEKMLKITDSTQLPAMVIVDVKSLKPEYLPEVFSANSIKGFLNNALNGDGFTGTSIPVFDYVPNYRPWVRDEL